MDDTAQLLMEWRILLPKTTFHEVKRALIDVDALRRGEGRPIAENLDQILVARDPDERSLIITVDPKRLVVEHVPVRRVGVLAGLPAKRVADERHGRVHRRRRASVACTIVPDASYFLEGGS